VLRRFAPDLIAQEARTEEGGAFAQFVTLSYVGGRMRRLIKRRLLLIFLLSIGLCGCQDLVPHDTQSLLIPRFQRSEIFGFIAGLGTTFAAVPDLLAMLRRRSAAGINPRMAGIMGVFQILWVYYGLLILSRPVIAWNVIGILINSLSVAAYVHFVNKGKANPAMK
jgi:MtN3 and saliva related transmembrane protein